MSRYFDDDSISTITCQRCGMSGHTRRNCSKEVEEYSKCLLCAQTGHLVADCPQAAKGPQFSRSSEYAEEDDNQESVDETGVICVACGEKNHSNCKFFPDRSIKLPESCAKCGNVGHTEINCRNNNFRRGHRGRYSTGSTQSYDDDRNDRFFERPRKRPHSQGPSFTRSGKRTRF